MAKKRRNSGHTGSSKGREDTVHCYHCNRLVSRSKAKRVTRRLKYIEPAIAKELKKSGTVLFDWTFKPNVMGIFHAQFIFSQS